ncbi:MAG: hypothetical protein RLN72_10915, partial [Henriciella sp.]
MKSFGLVVIAALALTGCHGANCAKGGQPVISSVDTLIDIEGAKQVATNEVYERHPTRALVDAMDAEWMGGSPPTYEVHIEMTGSPEARAIYDVVVTETPD